MDSTGGEAEHTLTTSEMPKHGHEASNNAVSGATVYTNYCFQIVRNLSSESTARFKVASGSDYYVNACNPNASDYASIDDISQSSSTANTGGSAAHNNMPPYRVAYCWLRTA